LNKVTIICDGGSTPNPGVGGWGAVLHFEEGSPHTKTASGGSDYATNNEMELAAILGGIEALGEEAHEVLIKTDSQIAHSYLTGLKGPGKENLLAIAEEIRHLVRTVGHNVMVQKVKASETLRAHALAQIEMDKRESKPVPMKL
jgi:ribonuclease HI